MTTLLRLERAALFAAFIALFAMTRDWTGMGWVAFAVVLIAPDVSFVAYLAGPKTGALGYNAVHTYLSPAALGLLSLLLGWPYGVGIAFVWAAHIAGDRALGYGLKLQSGFKDTHLGRIGGRLSPQSPSLRR